MRKILYIIPLFILAFTFTGGPPSGWYQQFMPDIGGRQINDITFLDSLTGFAVVSKNVNPDTSSILKTTNGGDNWQIVITQSSRRFSKVKFINSLTGFISGGSGSGTPYLYKTTNGGDNWFTIPAATFGTSFWDDMSVLNEDTIWLVDDNSLNGGVFRTTNGGVNWEQQFSDGNQNPNKIYMYNARIGYFSAGSLASPNIYKTTNSGLSWNIIIPGERFIDIEFTDSLNGWRAGNSILKKTTDGGLNWITQQMPTGGIIFSNNVLRFSTINEDTVWANGGYVLFPNSQVKSILYRTTNGGSNWHYQIPDTNLPYFESYIEFTDSRHGWAYSFTTPTGIHTLTGGDTNWITNIEQISNQLPSDFLLYQNYPNPFNPVTNLKFKIKNANFVKLIVFDIAGKEIATLVNERLSAGEYQYKFDGSDLTSGVYFYQLQTEGFRDTKKMLLIK